MVLSAQQKEELTDLRKSIENLYDIIKRLADDHNRLYPENEHVYKALKKNLLDAYQDYSKRLRILITDYNQELMGYASVQAQNLLKDLEQAQKKPLDKHRLSTIQKRVTHTYQDIQAVLQGRATTILPAALDYVDSMMDHWLGTLSVQQDELADLLKLEKRPFPKAD